MPAEYYQPHWPHIETITPLLATACTLGLFSVVLLIIVLDTVCRNRRKRHLEDGIQPCQPKYIPEQSDMGQSHDALYASSEEEEASESHHSSRLHDVYAYPTEAPDDNDSRRSQDSPINYEYEGTDDGVKNNRNELGYHE
ncbi:unnamed protein product [Dicrocoelium dendriticum]|nr:unnamed protein product [Dicrocoelium dendriticum]